MKYNRHTQGLQILDIILQEKSWDVLIKNGIKDTELLADSRVALKFIRLFYNKYKEFPPKEIVMRETKVVFPARVPLEFALEDFNNYKLSKELQNIFKSAGSLAVSNPLKCLSDIKSAISGLKVKSIVTSFKEEPKARFDQYLDDKTKPIRGILPAWEGMEDAFSVYENGTLNVILGIVSTGKCVEENTVCISGNGVRMTIKQIVENKKDIFSIDPETGDFSQKTPTDWFYSGEKECVELKFKTKDTLVVSYDHPILTDRGWIKAKDLQEREIIARVGKLPKPKTCLPKVCNDEITLIAALMADGTISDRKSTKYTKQDKKLVQLMKETCKRLDIEFYKTPSQQKNENLNWTVRALKVAELLDKYKIPASTSHDKKLPNFFFKLPDNNLKRFVSVFWNHDGRIGIDSDGKLELSVTSSSQHLIDDIRQILLRLGIFSIKSYIRTELDTDQWQLSVPGQEHKKFLRKFDILKEDVGEFGLRKSGYIKKSVIKDSPLKYSNNVFWDRLVSITPVGKKRTYDLSVEGTHSFEAAYTHVHNSWLSCCTAQCAAFYQNKKVLLISMENPKRSMDDRLESLYYKLPFGDLKKGLIDLRTERYWKESLHKLTEEDGDILVVDSNTVKNVSDMNYQIEAFNPDFVILDGGYKLASEHGSMGYEKSSETLQAIEDSAKNFDIPILATSQLNETAQKAVGGRETAFSSRFNKEWLMNPTSVCCLVQTPDDLLYNRVKCIISKAREAGDISGVADHFYINQDRVRMDFSQIKDEYLDLEGINSLL